MGTVESQTYFNKHPLLFRVLTAPAFMMLGIPLGNTGASRDKVSGLQGFWEMVGLRRIKAGRLVQSMKFEIIEGGVLRLAPAIHSFSRQADKLDDARETRIPLEQLAPLLLDGVYCFFLPQELEGAEGFESLKQIVDAKSERTWKELRFSLYASIGDPDERVKELIKIGPEPYLDRIKEYFLSMVEIINKHGLSSDTKHKLVNYLIDLAFTKLPTRGFERKILDKLFGTTNINELYHAINIDHLKNDDFSLELQRILENTLNRYSAYVKGGVLDFNLDEQMFVAFKLAQILMSNNSIAWIKGLSEKSLLGLLDMQFSVFYKSKYNVSDNIYRDDGSPALFLRLAYKKQRYYAEISDKLLQRAYDDLLNLLKEEDAETCSVLIEQLCSIGEDIFSAQNVSRLLAYARILGEVFSIISSKKSLSSGHPHKYTEADYKEMEAIKKLQSKLAGSLFRMALKQPERAQPFMAILISLLKKGRLVFDDTSVIQEEIARFLYGEISPVWQIVRQFIKSIPYSWKEIGVSPLNCDYNGGRSGDADNLRGITIEIDKLGGNIGLLHLLRVQVHSNTGPQDVVFVEEILKFWLTGKKGIFKGMTLNPAFIQAQIEESREEHTVDKIEQAEVDQLIIQKLMQAVAEAAYARTKKAKLDVDDLFEVTESEINEAFTAFPSVDDAIKQKVRLMLRLYYMLRNKYGVHKSEIKDWIIRNTFEKDLISMIISHEEKPTLQSALSLLDEILKVRLRAKNTILSPGEFDAEEYAADKQLYYKRHADPYRTGICGRYSEPRFDLFNADRVYEGLENLIIEEIFSNYPQANSGDDLHLMLDIMWKLINAAQINGVATSNLVGLLKLSQIRTLSLAQLKDVISAISEECRAILDGFNIRYRFNQSDLPKDREEEEAFLGAIIADEVAFKRLGELSQQIHELLSKKLKSRGNSYVYQDHSILLDGVDLMPMIGDRIGGTLSLRYIVGSKAANLVRMERLGLDVPSGFIVSAEMFKHYTEEGQLYSADLNSLIDPNEFDAKIRDKIACLENETGKKYGGLDDSLIVSVRSGSVVSMPGMLETITNVGMNKDIAQALSVKTHDKWFAYDCYRRFIQSYAMAVFGVDREVFHQVIEGSKKLAGVKKKAELTGDQMEMIAEAYKKKVNELGFTIPDSPILQLIEAIKAVNASWRTDRTKQYRAAKGISDEWGTAIIVQEMVYGNIGDNSGTGVLFTHDPMTGKKGINGSYKLSAQGPDIVDGVGGSVIEIKSLRESNTRLYMNLCEAAEGLYRYFESPQDIEFTVSDGRLYFLQTRDLKPQKNKHPVFDEAALRGMKLIGIGSPIAGDAFSGRVVLRKPQDISKSDPEEIGLLYITRDLTPENLSEILAAQGFVVINGSATSHAAITLRALGKTGVVFPDIEIASGFVKIGEEMVKEGDIISIDGRTGMIYLGQAPLKKNSKGETVLV